MCVKDHVSTFATRNYMLKTLIIIDLFYYYNCCTVYDPSLFCINLNSDMFNPTVLESL